MGAGRIDQPPRTEGYTWSVEAYQHMRVWAAAAWCAAVGAAAAAAWRERPFGQAFPQSRAKPGKGNSFENATLYYINKTWRKFWPHFEFVKFVDILAIF